MPRSERKHPDDIRFGEILKNLRLQREWSLQRLARASGLSANFVAMLEQGYNMPSLATIINLATVLGVDPGELVRHVAAGRRHSPPAVLPPLPEDEPSAAQ